MRVELADLRGRDAEDLPQNCVGDVLHVVGRGDQVAELQLDQVVDLLLREVLHHLWQEIKMQNFRIACLVN